MALPILCLVMEIADARFFGENGDDEDDDEDDADDGGDDEDDD
jgi:hypothetical protein